MRPLKHLLNKFVFPIDSRLLEGALKSFCGLESSELDSLPCPEGASSPRLLLAKESLQGGKPGLAVLRLKVGENLHERAVDVTGRQLSMSVHGQFLIDMLAGSDLLSVCHSRERP